MYIKNRIILFYIQLMVGGNMETYNCNDCSMEVKGLTCGKCESELVYAEIGDNSIGVSNVLMDVGK